MMFLTEGNRVLFRFCYAILKLNKKALKQVTDAGQVLELL